MKTSPRIDHPYLALAAVGAVLGALVLAFIAAPPISIGAAVVVSCALVITARRRLMMIGGLVLLGASVLGMSGGYGFFLLPFGLLVVGMANRSPPAVLTSSKEADETTGSWRRKRPS